MKLPSIRKAKYYKIVAVIVISIITEQVIYMICNAFGNF